MLDGQIDSDIFKCYPFFKNMSILNPDCVLSSYSFVQYDINAILFGCDVILLYFDFPYNHKSEYRKPIFLAGIKHNGLR